jgi:hypothetical protein
MTRRTYVVVTTPDGERLHRIPAQAAEAALELLLEHGWEDNYFVTLTFEVRGYDYDGDTSWLERELGLIDTDEPQAGGDSSPQRRSKGA